VNKVLEDKFIPRKSSFLKSQTPVALPALTIFGGTILLTLSEQQYFVCDTAPQSAK